MSSPTPTPEFHPKIIVFDLLTALLDSWTIWSASIPPSETQFSTGTIWRKEYLNLTYGCGAYKSYESLVSQAAVNVGLSPLCAESLLHRFDEIKPWDEVLAVLAKLHAMSDVKLGVVTNCSDELGRRTVQNLEEIVRRETGVEGFKFDAVVTAEEVGFYKPDSRPYRAALEKLGVQEGSEVEDALFVAGSSADIPGASAVGMRVCWNNHVGLERRKEDRDVEPWREGRNLVAALGDILG